MTKRAIIFWFTGMSGAGKTTLANAVRDRLVDEGQSVLILDGDDIRNRLHKDLGFTPVGIRANNERIAALCKEQLEEVDFILVPIISPYRESRQIARSSLAPGFYEIYIAAPLHTLQQRDTKGFYGAAMRGEMSDLIGVSAESPYEPPESPDLTINTNDETLQTSVERLLQFAGRCSAVR
jgi:adenylyl-sulfate kinase